MKEQKVLRDGKLVEYFIHFPLHALVDIGLCDTTYEAGGCTAFLLNMKIRGKLTGKRLLSSRQMISLAYFTGARVNVPPYEDECLLLLNKDVDYDLLINCFNAVFDAEE